MKFRSPETGEVFEDIAAARFAFCSQKCRECPISCWNNEDETRCDIYCHDHLCDSARLMGYEIIREPGVDFPEPEYDPDEVAFKGVESDPVKPLEIEEVKCLESEAMKEDTPMSTRIRPAIEKLAEMEKRDANRVFPLFHSLHEGYAVLLEEAEEVASFHRHGEYIMLKLRTTDGVDEEEFYRRFRLEFTPYAQRLSKYIQAGYCQNEGGVWRLTPKGMMVSNGILTDVLESELL